MGTICHIRPVDKDQNVSSGDAEQTWPPAEGLAEMAGVTEFAVRNCGLGLRAPRPQHLEALARALGVDPAALTDYKVETAHDALEVLFRLEEGFGARSDPDTAGARVVVDPVAPGAQKLDAAVRAWVPKRARRDSGGDLRRGVRRLEARVRRENGLRREAAWDYLRVPSYQF